MTPERPPNPQPTAEEMERMAAYYAEDARYMGATRDGNPDDRPREETEDEHAT